MNLVALTEDQRYGRLDNADQIELRVDNGGPDRGILHNMAI